MFEFFENIIIILRRHDNQVFIVAIYLIFCASLIVVRMVSHLHVSGVLALFQRESYREIKNRGDVSKIKNKMLRKVTAEYIRVAERAVTNVPTKQIVDRAVANMGLLGWRYDNLVPFVEAFEKSVLWIGVIFAFIFSGYAYVYGVIAVGSFVVLRFSSSFFSINSAREQLADEMVIYAEREIGRFFAADSGGAILRLKNDLTEAMDKQSGTLKKTMDNMSQLMQATMKEISANMIAASTSIGSVIQSGMDENIKNMNKDLSASFDEWRKTLEKGVSTHELINDSANRISGAGHKLQVAAELLAAHMQGHSGALSNHLISLVDSIESLKDGYTHLAMHQDVLAKQAQYIEKNQASFENIAASYETSLKHLAASIGDVIGTYVSVHAEESAKTLNDAVKLNIDRLIALTNREQV